MLKTCANPGCEPLEQTRGEMKPGDYHDIIIANRGNPWSDIKEPEKYGVLAGTPEAVLPENNGYVVEISDDGRADFRICCKVCGRATPWNKSDAPGMPGIGKVFTRNLWNGAE